MITKTYTFYWYDISSTYRKKDRIKNINKTWTMSTEKDVDLYAKYEANRMGAFKYEEYLHKYT